MKIKDKYLILGYDYNVVVADLRKLGGIINPARSDCQLQKIYIASNQHQQQIESSLIHEFIEIINTANHLDLTETQVCTLETGLYQTLKNNDMFNENE